MTDALYGRKLCDDWFGGSRGPTAIIGSRTAGLRLSVADLLCHWFQHRKSAVGEDGRPLSLPLTRNPAPLKRGAKGDDGISTDGEAVFSGVRLCA